MKIKGFDDCDFTNYRKPSLFVEFPYCSGKCDIENGTNLCHGAILKRAEDKDISVEKLYEMYSSNPFSKAIVFGGLEPMDSMDDVIEAVDYFRKKGCLDEFVIYTGYTEEEVCASEKMRSVLGKGNIIVKYGRFRPNQKAHHDDILGVDLVSDNQYAVRYFS